jgi:hypothetical protein
VADLDVLEDLDFSLRLALAAMPGHECLQLRLVDQGSSSLAVPAELRTQLAGPSPTPLERLLVEVIISNWLQTHFADAAYAQAGTQTTPAALRELQKRQDSSQRRHMAAIKQLALVRSCFGRW